MGTDIVHKGKAGANDSTTFAEKGKLKFCERAFVTFRKFGLKHVTYFLLLVFYAFFGGWLFMFLERDTELELRELKANETDEAAIRLADRMIELLVKDNGSTEVFHADALRLVENFQSDHSLRDPFPNNWDFWGSLFYAGTIFTTIGYGNYAPATTEGRIATMLYALVGIPLVLATLSNLGELLARCTQKLWNRIQRSLAKLTKVLKKRLKHGDCEEYNLERVEDRRNREENIDQKEFELPLLFAVFVLLIWILFCSALFRLWETNWSYFDAFYFFFISLTTIGLGDITPDHPKTMLGNFILILIGLALISFVINVIQLKIEALKRKTTALIERIDWKRGIEEKQNPSDISPDTPTDGESAINENTTDEPYEITLGIFGSRRMTKESREKPRKIRNSRRSQSFDLRRLRQKAKMRSQQTQTDY